MNPVLRYLQRWRHSRGFGVHSPFAFHFITDVLRQRHAYYAYERLAPSADMRTLFRVALCLRPSTVAVLADDCWRHAIEAACPAARLVADPADAELIVLNSASVPAVLPATSHVVLIGRDDDFWHAHLAAMTRGMTFDNGRSIAIAVAHAHLPRHDFRITF